MLLAVQARSTSKRLPGKVSKTILGKPLLDYCLDGCKDAAMFLNRQSDRIRCSVALLVPNGDPLVSLYKNKINIIEGDEEDCLSRYVKAMNQEKVDYIVRITGDCIYMPSYVISRAVKTAIKQNADFVTNCMFRMNFEGSDTEVMSKGILNFLNREANTPRYREHTTLFLYEHPEKLKEFKVVNLFEKINLSHIKTSIDSQEELMQAEKDMEKILEMKEQSIKLFGFGSTADGS